VTSPAPFGPVRKLRWLKGVAKRRELSRADLALLIVLADHVNSDTGKAWPAYPRLASTAGVSVRTAKRGIVRLTTLKLVTIAEHGGPGRSNRYGLNWALFEATGDGDTTDTMQTAMVTPVTTIGDTAGTDMVSRLTPDPINPSEHKAKDEIDRSQADGASAATPLGGACGLSPAGKGYAAFWEAWGRRVTVADTERLIDAAIDAGTNLADVVEGAVRFQHYCTDTGKPARMTPAAFVKGEKWRDDWQLVRNPKADKEKPKAQPTKAKARGKASQPEKSKRGGKFVWDFNPAEFQWSKRHLEELGRIMKQHNIKRIRDGPEVEIAQKALEPWYKANPRPPGWMNRLTGETWGTIRDNRPADDWRPPATERQG
jgi:hypothetical protein